MELTYSSYLKIDEILNLQELQSENKEHDEMLFIIIHQAYELWFKQIIHEFDFLKRCLDENDLIKSIKTQKRINTILKVIVHQIDILETMTPLEFLSFRDYLQSASGFQSYQFRELEFLLGNKNIKVLERFDKNPIAKEKLSKRFKEETIWDSFLVYLSKNVGDFSKELIRKNVEVPIVPNEDLQKILINIYKSQPILAIFCELLIDFDEGLQEWRYRHVKKVERTIGAKIGTGGSEGVKYLLETLFKPIFPDLWIIRAEFKND